MRFKILLLLCFAYNFAAAQVNVQSLIGSWVATKVTFLDGTELPDDNLIKYTYVKYTFRQPDKLNAAGVYNMYGTALLFEVKDNLIYFKSTVGSFLNVLQVVEMGQNNLVLLQRGRNGFDDPESLKYYFTRETTFQNTLPLSANDILSARPGDTVYKMSPKIYALYKGESFATYLSENIGHGYYMHNRGGHLVASYRVSKNGVADSLKIIEGIDPDFDKYFTGAFNSARKDFTAAKLNGKYVNVRMLVELRYGVGDIAIPASFNSQSANTAYNAKAWDVALYYFDLAMAGLPFDRNNLYKRGMCKLMLGNTAGACADWKKIKELGGTEADTVLAKYCK